MIILVHGDDNVDEVGYEIDILQSALCDKIYLEGFDGFAHKLFEYFDACMNKSVELTQTAFNTNSVVADERFVAIIYAINQFYINEMKGYPYSFYEAIDKGQPRAPIRKQAAAEAYEKCKILKDSVDRSIKAYKDSLSNKKPAL